MTEGLRASRARSFPGTADLPCVLRGFGRSPGMPLALSTGLAICCTRSFCTRTFAARELLLHEKSAAREVYCTRFWHPICPDSSKSWRNCLGDGDTGGVRQVQASKPKLQPQDSCGLASPGRTSLPAFGKAPLAFETGSKTFRFRYLQTWYNTVRQKGPLGFSRTADAAEPIRAGQGAEDGERGARKKAKS